MKTINITVTADDPKHGMTIGEMYEFVREAMAAGVPDDTVVGVRNGWRGQLQQLAIAGEVTGSVRTVDLDGPGEHL